MAFFSRLEERKGIKLFVDALHRLDYASLALNQVDMLMSNLPVHLANPTLSCSAGGNRT